MDKIIEFHWLLSDSRWAGVNCILRLLTDFNYTISEYFITNLQLVETTFRLI